jgi:hypothetical protein
MSYIKQISNTVSKNRDDLFYLLIAGFPFGILLMLVAKCMDFTNLF